MTLRQIHNPSGAYSSFFDSSASESRNSPKMACSAFSEQGRHRQSSYNFRVLFVSAEFDLSLPPQVFLLKETPRQPLVLAAEEFHILYLAELSAINKARIFIAQAALCFLGLAQLLSTPAIKVSVALYVMAPQSHLHSQRRTLLFPLVAYLFDRPSTVRLPICCPVRSFNLMQPQLLVCPLTRFEPRTTDSLPQSHRHSQESALALLL